MNKLLFLIGLVICFCACKNKSQGDNSSSEKNGTNTNQVSYLSDSTFYYAKIKVSCHAISESEYDTKRKEFYPKDSLSKITNLAQARSLLNGIAFWSDSTDDMPSYLEKIKTRDNEVINIQDDPDSFDFLGFVAYFPTEDVLLLEGGHASDITYNLTTGESTETIGNPEMSYTSHDQKYKIMGYYTGQAAAYFFQKKENGEYMNVFPIQYYLLKGYDMEYIIEGFWNNANSFYFSTPQKGSEEILTYYRLDTSPYQRSAIDTNFLIKGIQAGKFQLGMDLSGLSNTYDLQTTITQGEEGSTVVSYDIFQSGVKLFALSEDDEESEAKENKVISEIKIKDDRYLTDKLIGTSSTINDFRNAYPDMRIFYSYISDAFWMETEQYSNVQFIVDEKGFTQKNRVLQNADSIELPFSDFNPDTPIRSIRIY